MGQEEAVLVMKEKVQKGAELVAWPVDGEGAGLEGWSAAAAENPHGVLEVAVAAAAAARRADAQEAAAKEAEAAARTEVVQEAVAAAVALVAVA